MKVVDILTKLAKGEVVRNKRVLSVLKRAGLIYNYSQWNYLESQKVFYIDEYDNKRDYYWTEFGKEIMVGEKGSYSNPFESREEMYANGYDCGAKIRYKGFAFRLQYISGCFQPYLIKIDGPCE